MTEQEQHCPHCEMKIAFTEGGAIWLRNHHLMECVNQIKYMRETYKTALRETQESQLHLQDKYHDALQMIMKLQEENKCLTTSAQSAESAATASSAERPAHSATTRTSLSMDIANITKTLDQTSAVPAPTTGKSPN